MEDITKACQFFKRYQHMISLVIMLINKRTVLELQGVTNDHETNEATEFVQIPGTIRVM